MAISPVFVRRARRGVPLVLSYVHVGFVGARCPLYVPVRIVHVSMCVSVRCRVCGGIPPENLIWMYAMRYALEWPPMKLGCTMCPCGVDRFSVFSPWRAV